MTVTSRGFQCAPVLGLRSLQLPCPRALASGGAPRLKSLKETFLDEEEGEAFRR
jgi:hypothetical protein